MDLDLFPEASLSLLHSEQVRIICLKLQELMLHTGLEKHSARTPLERRFAGKLLSPGTNVPVQVQLCITSALPSTGERFLHEYKIYSMFSLNSKSRL